MSEAIRIPNFVALSITSQELGEGFFAPPQPKVGLSNSQTTIGLT